MNKTLRRVLAAMFVMVMTFSMLAGCSAKEEATTAAPATESTTAATTAATEATTAATEATTAATEAEETTQSGIILTTGNKEETKIAEIIGVGDGENLEGKNILS